jgi:hypothetical protein
MVEYVILKYWIISCAIREVSLSLIPYLNLPPIQLFILKHDHILQNYMFLEISGWIGLVQCFFNKIDAFMALRFIATGAPPAVKGTRILPMIQHADNIWNEGKFLPLFTNYRRCWKRCPSARKYLSQLTVSLKTRVQQSFLHLQHTRHHLSLDGFSNCVAVLALDFDSPISWARRISDFLGVCSSLAPVSSNFSSLSTRRLCFSWWKSSHHEIYFEIFADTFQQIRISHRCYTEIHVALKYSEPCRATLLTNC